MSQEAKQGGGRGGYGGRGGGRGGPAAGRGGATRAPVAPQVRMLSGPEINSDDEEGGMALNRTQTGARPPMEVLAYVFVGDMSTATEKKVMKDKGITTIINCTKDECPPFEHKGDFEYHEFDAEEDGDLRDYFDKVMDIVWDVKEKKGKVLLYCSDAKVVSPALILSYMLNASKKQDKTLPLKKAIEFINSKVPGIQLNDTAKLCLADLEEQLYEEVSIRIPNMRGGRSGKGKRGK